jgi:DNA-directed RNA polymerase specialized sigma24 family protein
MARTSTGRSTGHDGELLNLDLDELYRTHRDRLVNYAARWVRNRYDAEDAVHEAFLVALAEINTVRPTNPGAWLTAVTRHRALEATVAFARSVPAGDAIQATPQPSAPGITNAGLCMADPDTALYVLAALDELTPRQREALHLWAVDGLNWPQVAQRMGITTSSARRRVLESLQHLRTTGTT